MTKPEHRPGTDLSVLDQLCARESTAPDEKGKEWGLTWAAWRQYPADSDRHGKIKVYVADAETGELIEGLETYAYDRQRTRPYHTVETWDELHKRLWRMYWRRFDHSDPLEELQSDLRFRADEKAHCDHYEQWRERQRATWRVETERTGGRTLNRLIQQS